MKKALYYLTRNGRYKNAGEILSAVYRLNKAHDEAQDDVDRWGAPGECHQLVTDGFVKDAGAFIKSFELPYRRVLKYLLQIMPPKYYRYNLMLDLLFMAASGSLLESRISERRSRLMFEKSGVLETRFIRNKKAIDFYNDDKEYACVLKVIQPEYGYISIYSHPFFVTLQNLAAGRRDVRFFLVNTSYYKVSDNDEFFVIMANDRNLLHSVTRMAEMFHITALSMQEVNNLDVYSKGSASGSGRADWNEFYQYENAGYNSEKEELV